MSTERHQTFSPQELVEKKEKYSVWQVVKGNEATYLFFPTAAAFIMVVLSSLSSPVISGMSLADIKPQGELGDGVVKFGSWGWCVSGVKNVGNGCSALRPFGGPVSTVLEDLPPALLVLKSLDGMVPKGYNPASDAFTVIACLIALCSLGACLAASGAWDSKWQKAFKWTSMAYWFAFISFIFTAIEFGLDIRKYVFIANAAVGVQSSLPTVTVGPVIWLKMVALILNLGCCLARLLWLKNRPRPSWTMTTSASQAQHTVALPPSDVMPPTWETLDIKDAAPIDNDKMLMMSRDSVVVHEVASPDFSAPPRLPEGRGGAV